MESSLTFFNTNKTLLTTTNSNSFHAIITPIIAVGAAPSLLPPQLLPTAPHLPFLSQLLFPPMQSARCCQGATLVPCRAYGLPNPLVLVLAAALLFNLSENLI
jgi:hypothetical protein